MEAEDAEKQMEEMKCVACGDAAVGKTCMLISFVENKFPEKYVPTVFDNHNLQMMVDEQVTDLAIWDTAGTEDYVADRKSLEKIKTFWIPEIEREAPGTEMFIVGTKADLREERPNDDSIISTSEGKAFAANLGLRYFECSALTQDGLRNVFVEAIRVGRESRKVTPTSSASGGGGAGCQCTLM